MSIRRVTAVGVLCCVGMLVVTSLFASPAQRAAYRTAPAERARQRLNSAPGSGGAQASTPTGKADHC